MEIFVLLLSQKRNIKNLSVFASLREIKELEDGN